MTHQAAALTARLDRLPASRTIWWLVWLLSLGAFFEMYELFQTAYVSPGLIRSGVFSGSARGLFGLSDQATFAAATFAGLFLGTILFGSVSDGLGRRSVFTASLLWYTAATVVMACQSTAVGVDLWRFVAGVGLGVQMVTIDAYISELVPKAVRGRAFAFSTFIQFSAIPIVALMGWALVPRDPFGVSGWRWVPLFSAVGAMVVLWIRSALPESPRWLIRHGRIEEAERVVATIERRVEADLGRPLPEPVAPAEEESAASRFSDIWRPPYRRRTVMLMVFNFFQTIGFYGFGNWVPALLAEKGFSIVHSLQYSFAIALAYPLAPLLFMRIADRFERKFQIVCAAAGIAIFGILFSFQTGSAALVGFGVLVTASNCLLSYSYHAYQSELFPTGVRARAVGFCYSWSRLSTVFTSFMIAFFLKNFGTVGVFAFIAASMLVVIVSIGGFGPRTGGLALEEISH